MNIPRVHRFVPWVLGAAFLLLYLHLPREWDEICGSNDYVFADVAENIEGIRGFVFGRPLHRHVLFSAVCHPLHLVGRVVAPRTAVAFPTALFGAAGVALVYLVARVVAPATITAAAASVLYGFSAAQMVYAGMPETYVPTGALILASLLVWFHEPQDPRWTWHMALGATLVSVGLMNPVLGILLVVAYLIHAARTGSGRRIARVTAVLCASLAAVFLIRAAVLTAVMPRLTWWGTIMGSGNYLLTYGSYRHLMQSRAVLSAALGTFMLPIGAPPVPSFDGATVTAVYGDVGSLLSAYARSVQGMVFLVVFTAALVVLAWRGRLSPRGRWVLVPYLVLHTMFFLWFNPLEAFLYSPAAMGPLVLLIIDATHRMRRGRVGLVCLLISAAALNNLSAFTRPIPAPPASHQTFEGGRYEKSSHRR